MRVAATGLDVIAESSDEAERDERYRARRLRLRPDYRTAADAVERYLVQRGAFSSGDLATTLDDLAAVFEQCEADGLDVRAIFGEDPVEFAELLLANQAEVGWIASERSLLRSTIDAIAGDPRVRLELE
ncbi:DNA-binding ferritin-like protein (Dps family) [Agromyces sp. 3263]|uniref:DUF1048 domain-containing protein n=1 Tax=Agromyces sp. 3263 TaxID=2817750 RepID=UPI00285DD654|nr:DUF1048 domain-containing protein [Agromyces sp. 3263]MDR6905176.1 DNA-binding ferritin-like protein (Dps family) [Agromyces sp. 3263]